MLTIKVGIVPGSLQDVVVENAVSVATALELAGIEAEAGYEIKLNGDTVADQSTMIRGDSRLFLVKKVKGSCLKIKVGVVPGTLAEIATEDSVTVGDALEIANLEVEAGYEIKLDGETADLDDVITRDGARLFLVKKVKGSN